MNMKKTLAGVLASVVAVSAMATVAVSAKETEQKEGSKVIDVTKTGWNVTWSMESTITDNKGLDLAEGINFFDITGAYGRPIPAEVADAIGDIKLTIKGTAGSAESGGTVTTITREFTVKKANDYFFNVVKSGEASKGDLNLGEFTFISSVTASAEISTEEYTSEAAAKEVAKEAIAFGIDVNEFITTKTNNEKPNFERLYDDEGTVKKMDPAPFVVRLFDETKGISLNWAGELADRVATRNIGYAITKAIGDKKGAKLVFTFTAPEEGGGEVTGEAGPGLKYPGSEDWKDIAIVPAQTSMLPDGEWAPVSAWNDKIQGNAKIVDNKAEFDWDTMVASSGLNINSIGLANDLVIGTTRTLPEKGLALSIEKIEIKWPAKSFEDLSAGEGQAESEEAIVTTAAEVTTAADTTAATEAAKNPTTGNAPIALAVIPVAIAAAAIVAKKRG